MDLRLRPPPEIEALPPDYALYPELGDRALGFLTRGYPRRCGFCVVPVKEGGPRQVSGLDTLLQGRRKLILLDDNLLAHTSALKLLDELVRIVFTQNMNSMETYYRWLALGYAAQCGRIHQCLVETIFHHNGRPRMGGFL